MYCHLTYWQCFCQCVVAWFAYLTVTVSALFYMSGRCMFHFIVFLASHFYSQSRFIVILTYWRGFWYQDGLGWFVYVTINVDCCVSQFWWFTGILYIKNVCSWVHLLGILNFTVPQWLTRCACFSTAIYSASNTLFWPFWIWHNNFSILPQCVIGMSLGSRMSRGFARHISPILTFLDFPITVLSSTVVEGIEHFIT